MSNTRKPILGLTEQNMFFIGLYDVTYELYLKCKNIAKSSINKDNMLSGVKYKKELNQYIKKYGSIFCKTANLYFNDADLSSIILGHIIP